MSGTDRTEARRREGAVSVGGGQAPKKKGLAWLWILLALAVLAAVVLFLLSRNAWDEGDDDGLDLTNDSSRSGEEVDDSSTDERDPTDGGANDDGGDGAAPTTADSGSSPTTQPSGSAADAPLTANGQALLPVPAEATSVMVESVVSDEGFWVGENARERVFVRLRTGGAESPVQIEPGRMVSFTGAVTENPPDVSTFGVDADEGAAQLTEQGQHIEVALGDIRQG
jgi:hypothetical protein